MRQVALACLCGPFVLGCLAESPEPRSQPDDTAVALLDAVETDDYRSWEPPPTSADLPRRREASGAHGPWVEVYLAPSLLEAFFQDDALEAWPDGAAAVCESYETQDAADPFLIQVMRKTDGRWTWAQVDASGQPLTGERPDDCIGCHGGGEDFVFSLFLPNG